MDTAHRYSAVKRLSGYGIGILAVLIAAVAHSVLVRLAPGARPYLLFTVAVLVAGAFSGALPALLAAGLAAALVAAFGWASGASSGAVMAKPGARSLSDALRIAFAAGLSETKA